MTIALDGPIGTFDMWPLFDEIHLVFHIMAMDNCFSFIVRKSQKYNHKAVI